MICYLHFISDFYESKPDIPKADIQCNTEATKSL